MSVKNRARISAVANTMQTYDEFVETMELSDIEKLSLYIRESSLGLDIQYGKLMRVLVDKDSWKTDYQKVYDYCNERYHIVKGREN